MALDLGDLAHRRDAQLDLADYVHALVVGGRGHVHVDVAHGHQQIADQVLAGYADDEAVMTRRVVEMHFVCRDALNVTDFGDGTFESGVWYVSAEAARTVRTVALHNDKVSRSYRQGLVIGRRTTTYQGKTRFVFRVRDDGRPLAWGGGGSGEKGYVYG